MVRGSWDPHGVAGYCVGPEEDHCRYYRVCIPGNKIEIITDTLEQTDDNELDLPCITQDERLNESLHDVVCNHMT